MYQSLCNIPTIDQDDLDQEVELAKLMGRKSIKGPKIDFIRKQGMTGHYQRRNEKINTQTQRVYIDLNQLAITRNIDYILLPKVLNAIKLLSTRNQEILYSLFFLDMKQRDVGIKFSINQSRVSQIYGESIQLIRNYLNGSSLEA